MEQRTEKAKEIVGLQQQIQSNQEQIEFTQRQLSEFTSRSSRTEIDGVIVIDKANAGAASVKLSYLVESASWKPQYKLRSGKPKDPISVEYLAAIEQKTGEDWTSVTLILSTAQPQLNAAPPDLKSLEVAIIPVGTPMPGGGPIPGYAADDPKADAGKAYQKLQEGTKSGRAMAQAPFNQ